MLPRPSWTNAITCTCGLHGTGLRIQTAELEARQLEVNAAVEAVERERREVAAERARLASLAAEKEATVRSEKALREKMDAWKLQCEKRETEAIAAAVERERTAAARENAAALAEATAREAAEAAREKERDARRAQARADDARREAERLSAAADESQSRAAQLAEKVRRDETIELEEMHQAMVEEAVGVAALTRELQVTESIHEEQIRALHAQAAAALTEHTSLQSAAEQVCTELP